MYKVDADLLTFTAMVRIDAMELASDISAFEKREKNLIMEVDTSRREDRSDERPEIDDHPSKDKDADWKADWHGASDFAQHLKKSREEPVSKW
jgi:hypothetical protein